jgi:hypothetical protein
LRAGLKRLFSGAAGAAVAAGLLALGTAAAPAQGGHHVRAAKPRLVATPSTLVAATQIAPGDRIERLVELRVRGRGRLRSVYFRAAAKKSSALDADEQHGLRVAIDRCTKKWRIRGLAESCPGKRTVVLAQRPLVGRAKLKLGRLTAKTGVHLRLVLVFPADAANTLQAQSTDATYSFVGVAR